MTKQAQKTDGDGRLICLECGEAFHRLDVHLHSKHQLTPADYQAKHPGAEVLSTKARKTADDDDAPKIAPAVAKPKAKAKRKAGGFTVGSAHIDILEGLNVDDQANVPEHDEGYVPGKREHESLEALTVAISNDMPILFVGPTGAGKSLGCRQWAAAVNYPLIRVNFHKDERAADVIGEKTVEVESGSGQAVVTWKDGALLEAMRKGYIFLADELDACPAGILFVMQSVLEPGRTITLPTGERVKAHPRFRFVATANTTGRGDDSGLYTGTNILNEAFLDRWTVVVKVDYPDPDTEAAIVAKRSGIARAEARKMVEVAVKVREGLANEQVYCTFSTRRLVAWAELSMSFGSMSKAANFAVLNKLSSEDRDVVGGLIQRIVGSDI